MKSKKLIVSCLIAIFIASVIAPDVLNRDRARRDRQRVVRTLDNASSIHSEWDAIASEFRESDMAVWRDSVSKGGEWWYVKPKPYREFYFYEYSIVYIVNVRNNRVESYGSRELRPIL